MYLFHVNDLPYYSNDSFGMNYYNQRKTFDLLCVLVGI